MEGIRGPLVNFVLMAKCLEMREYPKLPNFCWFVSYKYPGPFWFGYICYSHAWFFAFFRDFDGRIIGRE